MMPATTHVFATVAAELLWWPPEHADECATQLLAAAEASDHQTFMPAVDDVSMPVTPTLGSSTALAFGWSR